ncbi:MAG: hypothetical protein V1758_07245 [Pseudomonadota bacterium]
MGRTSYPTNTPLSQPLIDSPAKMRNNQSDSDRSWKGSALALILFVWVSILLVGPLIFPPTQISTLPYAPEDSYICLWNFWWTKYCLLELQNPYWTDFLFHPLGTSLAFHAFPLTYGLVSVPIQLVVKDVTGLVLAMNVVIFFSFVLAAFGAYRLAVYVTGSRLCGFISGLIYAFIPYHFLNMLSLHLLAIEFLPFYILSLLKFYDRPSVRQAVFVALWLAISYYSSLEYTLYLLIFSALWFMYKVRSDHKGMNRKFLGRLSLAALCFILFAAPLLSQQVALLFRGESAIKQDFDELVFWSPALLSFVTPSRFHPVYGRTMSFAGDMKTATTENWGMRSEASLGLVTLGLAFASLIGFRRDGRIFWLIAGLCFLSLALGPYLRLTGARLTDIPLPYLLLYKYIPILRAGRDPTRFVPLAMLMLSIVAAFSVRGLLRRIQTKGMRLLVTTILAGLVLFESAAMSVGSYKPEVHPVYRRLAQQPGHFAIIDLTPEPYKLLPQAIHGKRLTYLEKTIPRSSSKDWMLPVEYDFRFPEKLLNLSPSELTTRFQEYRVGLRKYNIKYVIFPMSRQARLQIELAMHLGARISEEQGLFLCEFP